MKTKKALLVIFIFVLAALVASALFGQTPASEPFVDSFHLEDLQIEPDPVIKQEAQPSQIHIQNKASDVKAPPRASPEQVPPPAQQMSTSSMNVFDYGLVGALALGILGLLGYQMKKDGVSVSALATAIEGLTASEQKNTEKITEAFDGLKDAFESNTKVSEKLVDEIKLLQREHKESHDEIMGTLKELKNVNS